jgi:hypothetical protein
MKDWKERLTKKLEPILEKNDPRPDISSYDDMPYAIFRYDPEDEFAVRQEIELLQTRLEGEGKRVMTISLADCLQEALEKEGLTARRIAQAERRTGAAKVRDTVNSVLGKRQPLDDLVASRIPDGADPMQHVVFITRAGSLFRMYRTSTLLEQLKGKVRVPAVLFYPGYLDGAAGLRFMGVLDAVHNYRPKIF